MGLLRGGEARPRAWCGVGWGGEACVVVGRGAGGRCVAGGGDGVWGVCWSRVSPLTASGSAPLAPLAPRPCRRRLPRPHPSSCLSIPGPVSSLSRWGPGRPGATWPRRRRRRWCPLPRAPRGRRRPPASPSSPYPLGCTPFTPPTSWRPERASRSVCACRRWGLLGGGRGGVRRRCRVAGGGPGWPVGCVWVARVRLLPPSRLWRPSELPGPPVAGGVGVGLGGGLSGGGLGATPPPRASSRSPAAVLARGLRRFPPPLLPSRLSSRYLARSGAEV